MTQGTLTLEILNAAIEKLGGAPVPQYEFVVDDNWPKDKPVKGETETVTCRAHPFVEWLAKIFPFDPNTYFQAQKYTWRDAIMYDKSAVIFDIFGRGPQGKEFVIVGAAPQIDYLKRSLAPC